MQAIHSILVVVDPTVDRDFVVDRAKSIAKANQASLLFYINNPNTLTEHSFIYEGVEGEFFETQRRLFNDHYRKILHEVVSECQQEGISATSEFSEKHHLAEAIIEAALDRQPDLVMKSTHHHDVLERSLISNTDWRLIRKCPAPLLLVKPQPWHEDGSIVTAVDPLHSKADQSQLDRDLLAGARQFSESLNMTPFVFHSYYPFVSTLFPMGGESKEHLDRIREFHWYKVKELMGEFGIPEENMSLSEGDLVPSLVKFLHQQKANLLILGALSRNVIERAIIGNTAEKILEDCPCDVLVLKPSPDGKRV